MSSSVSESKFRWEIEDEEQAQLELADRQEAERAHARRRASLVELGVWREAKGEAILRQLPDPKTQGNPWWWAKLAAWIEKHPYKPDDIDYLVDAAKHPERFGDVLAEKPKLGRGKHMKGRTLSAETRAKLSEAAKRRWAEEPEIMREITQRGQAERWDWIRRRKKDEQRRRKETY
jgi:hypothetical protein